MRISRLHSLSGANCFALLLMAACGSTNNNYYTPIGTDGGLSAAGESCAREGDCASGLQCVRNVCIAGAGGSDGGSSVQTAPPQPSQLGQSCAETPDCGPGLVCVPALSSSPGGPHDGICDLANFGLTPTGKSCTGECNTGADCCELPTDAAETINAGLGGQIQTCEDIAKFVASNHAQCNTTPAPGGSIGTACFYYAAYCSAGGCSAKTWGCTNNQCVYIAPCSSDGTVPGGCASETRSTAQLTAIACNSTSQSCQNTATECHLASDCNGLPTADPVPAGQSERMCATGNCTCYNGGCYIRCSQDLDCALGYVCDTSVTLCKPAPQCSTNADCAAATSDANATCKNGSCVTPCAQDHDCSPSSGAAAVLDSLGPFSGLVCDPSQKQCVPVGCSSDASCAADPTPRGAPNSQAANSGVNPVCAPPAPAAGPLYQSAVTD